MRWLATLSAVAFVAACSGQPGESGTAITNVRIVADTIVAVGEVSPLGGVVAEPHVIDNVTDAGGGGTLPGGGPRVRSTPPGFATFRKDCGARFGSRAGPRTRSAAGTFRSR